ncbi:hypothetical protein LZ32DRAFT_93329 [Colletotrichum eremochloae]|nr:hypothetical protein LZ32DRAFT_93329 [Colletotrichum eremochloae]
MVSVSSARDILLVAMWFCESLVFQLSLSLSALTYGIPPWAAVAESHYRENMQGSLRYQFRMFVEPMRTGSCKRRVWPRKEAGRQAWTICLSVALPGSEQQPIGCTVVIWRLRLLTWPVHLWPTWHIYNPASNGPNSPSSQTREEESLPSGPLVLLL